MKSKTFRSPISMCTLQRVTMKTLLPYKLKVSTQTVTKDFVTLCPEYEVFEKIKKGLIKETIKVNNDKRDRVRTFKKIMLKSASDTMVLNMIMKNKKDIRRENKNTEREVRHQRILNEMRDIENCIDYKEDKKWYP